MSEGSLEERSEDQHTSRTDGRIFGNSGFRDGKIVGEKIRWDAGTLACLAYPFRGCVAGCRLFRWSTLGKTILLFTKQGTGQACC